MNYIKHQNKEAVKHDISSKVYKTYTKFVSIHWDDHNIDVFENEIKWLKILQESEYFPKLLFYNKESRIIVTTDCGEKLNVTNIPKNLFEQRDKILEELKKYNCRHNDIKPTEILIKNGKLNIVDFGWANELNKENPINWPEGLGDKFKGNTFNDEESFNKSIDFILEKAEKELIESTKNSISKIKSACDIIDKDLNFN
tara:strand:+ start:706 stop:1302 length:597 start_codon:yes stop_codon:yes gene_type:complete